MKNEIVKNNAISPDNIIFEDDDYILYKFHSTKGNQVIEYTPKNNFLELYLCNNGLVKLFGNTISKEKSLLFYDSQMNNIILDIERNATIFILQLSLKNLHVLLSSNYKSLVGKNIFSTQEPIIELRKNSAEIIETINYFDVEQVNTGMKALFLRGKILELISYFGKDSEDLEEGKCPFTSNKKNTIILAKDILLQNLKSAPKIESIANELGVSIKKLKQEFKSMYGFPIYTYYLNYKLDIAKELLDKKEKSILEISQFIGYSTSSHFISAFKNKYKITPKKYQNK